MQLATRVLFCSLLGGSSLFRQLLHKALLALSRGNLKDARHIRLGQLCETRWRHFKYPVLVSPEGSEIISTSHQGLDHRLSETFAATASTGLLAHM